MICSKQLTSRHPGCSLVKSCTTTAETLRKGKAIALHEQYATVHVCAEPAQAAALACAELLQCSICFEILESVRQLNSTLQQTCMLGACLGGTAAAQVPPAQVDEHTAHVRSSYERYVKRDAEHHKSACETRYDHSCYHKESCDHS